MAVNKLIPYWIQVREVEEPSTNWDQTKIHEEEPKFPANNLADYFEEFCREYQQKVHADKEEQKTFTVGDHLKRRGNTIEGTFKSGEWGTNADFWDIDERERQENAREENHAEEIPYYFLFHLPDESCEQALLILRKYKRKGIKTLFSNLFDPKKNDTDIGDAYMTISPHYSDKVMERIDEADDIASVRFRGKERFPAREEYADQHDIEKINHDISGQLNLSSELKLAPQENTSAFRKFVKGLVGSNDNEANFDYGKIENQNFSNANVTVVEGESQLTFSLWKEQIQMRMDVDPDEHELDIYGGHPTPYSIARVARQLANDLMDEKNKRLSKESLIPRSIGVSDDEEIQPPAE